MEKHTKNPADHIILDVRTPGEYHDSSSRNKHLNIGHIKGAIHVSLQDLQQKPEAIEALKQYKDREIYITCSHSYRSRTISNLLLSNGFTNVTNIQGGMSEWYRNYDELKPYAASHLERNINYSILAPSELYTKMKSKEKIVFFGFKNNARNSFDSMVVKLYSRFPDFANVTYFSAADSASLISKAKEASGKTIITFNTIGTGAAEMTSWLTQNGISNIHYLVGNLPGFFEYLVNFRHTEKTNSYLQSKSSIQFHSAISLCRALQEGKPVEIIDLRHDTVFSKTSQGTKLAYSHLRNAKNFFYQGSAEEFSKKFPSRDKEYVLLGHQNYVGFELADALLAKGYRVSWLLGGNERWEWHVNNIPGFSCKDYFEK